MNTKVMFSSNSNEWTTPDDLYQTMTEEERNAQPILGSLKPLEPAPAKQMQVSQTTDAATAVEEPEDLQGPNVKIANELTRMATDCLYELEKSQYVGFVREGKEEGRI